MKKKVMTVLMAAIMVGSCMTTVLADNVDIKVDGLMQVNDSDIINVNGYNLLGMRDVFEMLGAEVKWNSDKRLVTATKGDTTVLLYVDSNEATVNGETVKLPAKCKIVDNSVYIPIRFVSEALGCEIDWNEDSRLISIKATDGEYVLLNTGDTVTETTYAVTYEEALAMAVKKSSDLKTLDDTMVYLDELRDDLGDNMKLLDIQGGQINSSVIDDSKPLDEQIAAQLAMQNNIESVITVARSIKNVDIQEQLRSVNEQMIKDSLELMLKNYTSTIKTTEMQISLLEQSIELGKQNIENLELKHSLGYTSEYDLNAAKTEQKTNETNLETLKLNLASQKQNLKTFLGVNADYELYVGYDVTFDTLKDVKLESYVTIQREADPSIKVLKSKVTLAEYNKRTNSAYDSESTLSVENELKASQRALSDGKDNLEKNIRNGYNTLKQLEEQNKSLKLAVEQAKADYNKAVAAYKAGNATLLQVNQAKLGITSAEKAVEENAINYDMASFSFEHPYLLSGN